MLLGSASVLPFKDQPLNGVLSITLIEFLNSPAKAFKEINRILEPKGEVTIGTINALSAWFLFKRVKFLFKETAYWCAWFYTINQLGLLFAEAGFINVATRGVIYLAAFIPHFLIPLAKRLDAQWAASPLRHLSAFILVKGERL